MVTAKIGLEETSLRDVEFMVDTGRFTPFFLLKYSTISASRFGIGSEW
jgi:hypothetical protein